MDNYTPHIRIVSIKTIDSTNKYLERLIHQKDEEEGLVVVASQQTEGRGQRGTKWFSESGKNLTFSILLKPYFLAVTRQFMISKVIAISVLELLNKLIPGRDIKIKWPNDILIDCRKISGILITTHIKKNRIEYTIAGIGININQMNFEPEIPHPASVIMFTSSETDTGNCLKMFVERFNRNYSLLRKGETAHINENYMANLYRLNVESPYLYRGKKITGKITGVTNEGLLRLSSDNDNLITCDTKEIVYLD